MNWQFTSTADIEVPPSLIDQVLGQPKAVEVITLAARQRRAVLLVGEPGTGKSMLAAAMAELMPAAGLEDVIIRPNPKARVLPLIERLPAGQAEQVIAAERAHAQGERRAINYLVGLAVVISLLVGVVLSLAVNGFLFLFGLLAALGLLGVRGTLLGAWTPQVARVLIDRSGQDRAPFVDATGAHAGGLLGDVRHDPFQSGGYETEPHELVEPGAIHRAHGGVLFIDEISSLSMESQQRMLTALQQGELAITGRHSGSSGAMVLTEPVPSDTVLVVACNPGELVSIHPALRSRLRGFGYEMVTADAMERSPENELALARFVAQEVRRDGRIPQFSVAAVRAVVDDAGRRAGPGRLTLRLRELGGLVRIAGDLAAFHGSALTEPIHVDLACQLALSVEEQLEAAAPVSHPFLRPIVSNHPPVDGHAETGSAG